MPFDTRPCSHAERDEVVAAIDAYRSGPEPDAAVLVLDDRMFAPARSKYTAARLAFERAITARREASDTADGGAEKLVRHFRMWARSVADAQGKSMSGELSKHMGGTRPGEVVKRTHRSQLTKIGSLLNTLPDNPHLRGDPAKLSQLEATVASFEPIVAADEAATRDWRAKGKDSTKAMALFDKAYVKLVRSVRNLIGDEAAFAILPRFERGGGGSGGGG